ncbi:MAG: hypothetical protein QM750_24160 [Rubrivivax sp.]
MRVIAMHPEPAVIDAHSLVRPGHALAAEKGVSVAEDDLPVSIWRVAFGGSPIR